MNTNNPNHTPRPKGRPGWRVHDTYGYHVATSYEDQYTLEELKALYPEGYTFVPYHLPLSNTY